jgi:hypothetical protein
MTPISETDFIDALKCGVQRTRDLIGRLTDYHGGAVKTEYLITADIAREFVERGYEVSVECLNRHMVNAMTELEGAARKNLHSKRTDVAIMKDGIIPLAIIEVKIRANKFARIQQDLDKITSTMRMMQANFASKVIGASVFEMHIAGSRKRYSVEQFKAAALNIESAFEKQMQGYALKKPDFAFTMELLQSPDSGVVGREIESVGGELAWGQDGHATRYHVILIRSTRPVPAPPKTIAELRKVGER